MAGDMETDLTDGPEMVSDAYVHFMHVRSELSDFVTSYHSLARAAIEVSEDKYDEDLYKMYKSQSIFFLENYLLRISDIADIYLEDLLVEIAAANRSIFSEKEIASAEARLMKRDDIFDNEVVNIEAAGQLARLSKFELVDLIRDRIGFDIPNEVQNWTYVPLANQIRNAIVHNSSEVDRKLLASVHKLGFEYGADIGDPMLFSESTIMEIGAEVTDALSQIDDKISKYVQIHKRSRFGHFWLPRSLWGNEKLNKQTETLRRR